MSARGRHKVVLSDFKGKKRDEGAIDIELADGTFVTVDPPELWPDAVQPLFEGNDNVGAVRSILGEADYARLIDGGGSATLVMAIFGEVHGPAGESAASSST